MTDVLYIRARIALAVVAQECADLARGVVGDLSTPMLPGERIRKVRRHRMGSLTMTDRVVLAELADGTTWAQVADALGLDEDTARRRYEPVWDMWQSGEYDDEEDFGDYAVGLPGDRNLESTAQALDSWWMRHAEPWETVGAENPVSQVLVDGETAPGDR